MANGNGAGEVGHAGTWRLYPRALGLVPGGATDMRNVAKASVAMVSCAVLSTGSGASSCPSPFLPDMFAD